MMDKYAVFLDAGYLLPVLGRFGSPRPKICLLKLSEHVGRGDRRFRTYFYNCPPYQSPQPTAEERTAKSRYDRFIGRVELLPCFEVRHGRLRWDRDHNRPEQKMVDILLAIDLVLSLIHISEPTRPY